MEKYRLNPQIIVSEVAGEMVAVPLVDSVAQMNRVFTLNETAALIISLLATPRSVSELVEAIINEFDTDNEDVEADLREILDSGMEMNIFQKEQQ